MSADIILTDGIDVWGHGTTREAAIADAVANCLPQMTNGGETYAAVTPEWIGEQTERRNGLWLGEWSGDGDE